MSPTTPNAVPPAAAASPCRLLLIEDDPDQQELVVETLEEQFAAGCVTVAGTCAEAREADLPSFDLILCDVNLPDGNGLELLAHLRGRTAAPIVMLTGENDTAFAREAIRGGATDYVVKAGAYLMTMPLLVEKNLAAGMLARERAVAEASLRDEATRLQTELSDAEQRASTDAMTGCYNRRAFERIFAQLFAQSYRNGDDLTCVMIDLDKFKQVNDTLGHAVGDELIRTAARSIQGNLRQMDVACRYGGDEFILLLPRTDCALASAVANRIRLDYGNASAQLLKGEPRSMSIGVGSRLTATPPPANPEQLMEAADRALYQAKENGRNQIAACA